MFASVGRLSGERTGIWCGTADALDDNVRALAAEVPGGPAIADFAPGAHTRGYWNRITPMPSPSWAHHSSERSMARRRVHRATAAPHPSVPEPPGADGGKGQPHGEILDVHRVGRDAHARRHVTRPVPQQGRRDPAQPGEGVEHHDHPHEGSQAARRQPGRGAIRHTSEVEEGHDRRSQREHIGDADLRRRTAVHWGAVDARRTKDQGGNDHENSLDRRSWCRQGRTSSRRAVRGQIIPRRPGR